MSVDAVQEVLSDARRVKLIANIDKGLAAQQETTNDGEAALKVVQEFMTGIMRQTHTVSMSTLNYLHEVVTHMPSLIEWDAIYRAVDAEKHPNIRALMLARRAAIEQFWLNIEGLVANHAICIEGLDPAKKMLPDEVFAAIGGENRMP